jgi:hypothetical protein
MFIPEGTRRAAIATFGVVALSAAIGGRAALAQSGQAVRNIRVDVAPLRANAGDPTATWVEQELPGRPADAEGRHADGQDRLSDIGAEHRGHYPRRLVARQHHRSGDDRKRAMAGAGDDQLCGLADRSDHDRTVQSLSGVAARAGADVLDRQRPRRLTSKRGFAPLHSLRVNANALGSEASAPKLRPSAARVTARPFRSGIWARASPEACASRRSLRRPPAAAGMRG